MVLLFKVLFNHTRKRQVVVLHCHTLIDFYVCSMHDSWTVYTVETESYEKKLLDWFRYMLLNSVYYVKMLFNFIGKAQDYSKEFENTTFCQKFIGTAIPVIMKEKQR